MAASRASGVPVNTDSEIANGAFDTATPVLHLAISCRLGVGRRGVFMRWADQPAGCSLIGEPLASITHRVVG
jgi:hypothetical protein